MKNQSFIGAKQKASLIDLNIPSNFSGKLIVFIHGYMGFKDWGCWYLVEDYFTELGFGFCKYNVSHNGCSTEDSLNFVDLEAFAENNYTKECEDFQAVLSFIGEQNKPFPEIYVIGHSRGGGIALLQSKDEIIKKVATWATISDIGSRFPNGEALTEWKEKGYYSRLNGRTNQKMRHNYSQYIDFLVNRNNLDIRQAATENTKPLLLIHGDADTSVDIREGKELAEWSGKELHIIEGAAHTFGSSHPWGKEALPDELRLDCQLTAKFFLERN